MRTSDLTGLLGIFIGTSDRASRDVGIPIASEETIKLWATEQSTLLAFMNLDNEIQIQCASIIRACGGHTGDLKIGYHKSGIVNYKRIKEIISASEKEQFLIIWEFAVKDYEKNHNCEVVLFDNVFALDGSIPGILQSGSFYPYIDWPKLNGDWFHSKTLQGIVTEIISESSGIKVAKILNQSNISSDKKGYSASIGKANGKDVIEDHIDIIKIIKRETDNNT